jgi:hypothetical protein
MLKIDYEQMIRELCESQGIRDADEIVLTRHIEIDGITVAILHDEWESPGVLALRYDLGPLPGPELEHRMLAFNAAASAGSGHFGVLEGRNAVWCANVPCTEPLGGDRLFEILEAHVCAATRAIAACS